MDVLIFTEATEHVDAFIKLQNVVLDERIDKRILMMNLLKECGALTPMFYERDAFWINHKLWFETNNPQIKELVDTTEYEYDPLENYDWSEITHETGSLDRLTTGTSDTDTSGSRDITRNRETTGTLDSTTTDSGKDTTTTTGTVDTTTANSGSDKTTTSGTERHDGSGSSSGQTNRTLDSTRTDDLTTETKTSAYNEKLYQPESLVTNTGTVNTKETEGTTENENTSNTEDVTKNGSETLQHGKKVTVDSDTKEVEDVAYGKTVKYDEDSGENVEETTKETSKGTEDVSTTGTQKDATIGDGKKEVLGATGVYTKQNLIEQQRNVVQFNIINWIVRKYKRDNMYCVY